MARAKSPQKSKQLPLDGISQPYEISRVELDYVDPSIIYITLRRSEGHIGTTCFYVYHAPLKIYTSIGAKNIHHAANKVTKLFKGEWSGLTRIKPSSERWAFKTVKEFNRLINPAL